MDDVDGLRLKPYFEDNVPLVSPLAEPINLEGQLVTIIWNEDLLKAPWTSVSTA